MPSTVMLPNVRSRVPAFLSVKTRLALCPTRTEPKPTVDEPFTKIEPAGCSTEIVGAPRVVKVRSPAVNVLMPSKVFARKWYVVDGCKPVRTAASEVSKLPVTGVDAATVDDP